MAIKNKNFIRRSKYVVPEKLSVAILSAAVGKSPQEIAYSFVFDEAYRLAQRGLNIHVIRGKFENDSKAYGIRFHGLKRKIYLNDLLLFFKNLKCYPPLALLRRPEIIGWENLYAREVSEVVKEFNIDLIHAHFAYPEGFVGLLAKISTKRPLIVTCHGYDINMVPEIGYGIRLNRKYDSLVRSVLESANAIICVSNRMKEEVKKIGIKDNRIFVIFNAVDLERFRPPEKHELDEINLIRKYLKVKEKDLLILNARNLKPVYGIEYLILAAKIVTSHVRNVKFIITGEGELKEKLIKMIKDLQLEGNVRLIGTIPRSLMPKLMQASSLYVNTSLADGMAPSMLEACATGLPIVSFDVGGANDVIDNGVNGFLVPPKDYRTLAEKIIYLIENIDIMKEMGVRSRKKAEEKFNINIRISKIMEVYHSVIERNKDHQH